MPPALCRYRRNRLLRQYTVVPLLIKLASSNPTSQSHPAARTNPLDSTRNPATVEHGVPTKLDLIQDSAPKKGPSAERRLQIPRTWQFRRPNIHGRDPFPGNWTLMPCSGQNSAHTSFFHSPPLPIRTPRRSPVTAFRDVTEAPRTSIGFRDRARTRRNYLEERSIAINAMTSPRKRKST